MNKKANALRLTSIIFNIYWGFWALFGTVVLILCLMPRARTVTGYWLMLSASLCTVAWSAVGISAGIMGLRKCRGKGSTKALLLLPTVLIAFEIICCIVSLISGTVGIEMLLLGCVNVLLPYAFIAALRKV